IFTYWTGEGRRAGLWQMNSWQRCMPADFLTASSASMGRVDIVGSPEFQALPISMTIDPLSDRRSFSFGASCSSQETYSLPIRLKYDFLGFRRNGGELSFMLTLTGNSRTFRVSIQCSIEVDQ